MCERGQGSAARRIVALAAAVGIAGLASCATGEEAVAPSAGALFALAELERGVDALLLELGATARVEATQTLDEEKQRRWLAALARTTAPEQARAWARAAFAESYDPLLAAGVADWLRSPAGARCLAAERAADATDWDEAMSRFVDRFDPELAARTRLPALRRIVAATGAVHEAGAAAEAVHRIVSSGQRALAGVAEESETERAQARERARRVAGALRSQQDIVLLYLYRDVPPDDLLRYADFCESAAGRWLFGASRRALAAVADRLAVEFAAALSSPHGSGDRQGAEEPR